MIAQSKPRPRPTPDWHKQYMAMLVYMTIGTVAYMMVCGALVDLILIALATMVGLWAARIIAGG